MSDDIAPVKRAALSKRLRYEILRRDGHTCRYCGASAPEAKLAIDHVVPVSLGGSDDPTNLVTACGDCNGGKGATSAVESVAADVADLALEMAVALQVVSDRRRLDQKAKNATFDDFYDRWIGLYGYANYTNLPNNWEESLQQFMKRGLDAEDLLRLSLAPSRAISVSRGVAFRYFCGCCWNEIRTRETEAREMVVAARAANGDATTGILREIDETADPHCPICDGTGFTLEGSYVKCSCVRFGVR